MTREEIFKAVEKEVVYIEKFHYTNYEIGNLVKRRLSSYMKFERGKLWVELELWQKSLICLTFMELIKLSCFENVWAFWSKSYSVDLVMQTENSWPCSVSPSTFVISNRSFRIPKDVEEFLNPKKI